MPDPASGSRGSLRELPLTYHDVGVTLAADEQGTAGAFGGYQRSVCLGHGPTRWTFASTDVLRWGIKRRSGFTVVRDVPTTVGGADRPVVAGERYWLVAHLGPVRIHEPVQIVGVVDEVDRKGFAYGTLAGHPVSGEEAFLVEWRSDESVWLTIRSVTHPPTGLWRAGYPLALVAQIPYRRRYLRALRERV